MGDKWFLDSSFKTIEFKSKAQTKKIYTYNVDFGDLGLYLKWSNIKRTVTRLLLKNNLFFVMVKKDLKIKIMKLKLLIWMKLKKSQKIK